MQCGLCSRALMASHTLCMVCGRYFECAACCNTHCTADHSPPECAQAIAWWQANGTPLIRRMFKMTSDERRISQKTPSLDTVLEAIAEEDEPTFGTLVRALDDCQPPLGVSADSDIDHYPRPRSVDARWLRTSPMRIRKI